MSKYLDQNPDGTLEETIADPEECAWMFNEICCNDESPHCCEWPPTDYCDTCPLFAPEKKVEE